jgi:sirohydrochlorin cobaltochelatase
VIVGHGTRRRAESRWTSENLARFLQSQFHQCEVLSAFLDDEPSIASVWERTTRPIIVALPHFVSMGFHVRQDIPQILGIPANESHGSAHGREVHYLSPTINEQVVAEWTWASAKEAGFPSASTSMSQAWSGFPRRGMEPLAHELKTNGRLAIGELVISESVIHHHSDRAPVWEINELDEIRAITRRNPFRPQPFQTGVPKGWFVRPQCIRHALQVVETIYPGWIADALDFQQRKQVTSIAEMIGRQVGMFRELQGKKVYPKV